MGIIAQGIVRVAREKHLSQSTKETTINAADDFTGFATHTVVDGEVYINWN